MSNSGDLLLKLCVQYNLLTAFKVLAVRCRSSSIVNSYKFYI